MHVFKYMFNTGVLLMFYHDDFSSNMCFLDSTLYNLCRILKQVDTIVSQQRAISPRRVVFIFPVIFVIIKKDWQCKLRESNLHPISVKTPVPQYQPME